MNKVVLSLDELPVGAQSSAGGKGAVLAELHQSGYPVPDGFVVLPPAFDGDLLRPGAWDQAKAHLGYLRSAGTGVSFAVRSSALGEDSAQASFAGEFETVLDVQSDDAVRAAVETVRRSRGTERVAAYSQAHGLSTLQEMAVVVQRFVHAEYSGVLFTADPVTGSRTAMTGNFVPGLGDKLVSGEVEPRTFVLQRPKGRYEGPPELKPSARKLFKLAVRLERDLGVPQDIEWAIAGSSLYLLQSRPITTLQGFNPVTGEFNDSLTGDFVWSCVNLGEALSVVMTPLTWSMMRRGFSELDILPGYASVGNIGGRLYQNTTVGTSVLRALGKNVEEMAKEMAGVRDEYLERMDDYLVQLPEATLLAILPKGIPLRRKEKAALRSVAAYLSENPAWCRAARERIPSMQEEELASFLRDELSPRSSDAFWRNYATALRYGERVGRLRGELTDLVGAEDADALLSGVSGPDGLLASIGPVVGLARVARGELSCEAYLEEWGHRGALETEVSMPRPAEDPGWLDAQLEAFARSPVDVEALLAAQAARTEAAWDRFRAQNLRRVKSIGRKLDEAAEAARTREAARSESARLLWVARAWALRSGELTGIGEGAFFLTIDELLDLLDGKDAPTETIPARRQTYERYRELPPYPLIIRGRFDPFEWAQDPDRQSNVFDSYGLLGELTVRAPQENVLLGMPGSAGKAEGLVRRLDSPEEGGKLQVGEILVAAQTNIGWTLFFPRAAALVTDVGAPLSHAAIVARELGIPAVVNCGDATMRLHTGDRVRVDGSTGQVEILERV
jgi:phosphohistidine swiveling domain-containing protein